ncbi:DsbA family oxidoreductase [Actinoplanes couchii]|uniref:DSBA oxidoreductase n=1 Tax=Actinoplanes couchii TaxID=403638 RepID=A0ABQ3XRU0_9ACTN|nr:DsbA family oxidoreductase [Actinoplanes couchii]MDR6318446.1 putative DsbA family dithiol-disulfide isomerase [Actinoplanes couchii]GID61203.1 DSBA oxidoreductase [Actinoplanes couchii]
MNLQVWTDLGCPWCYLGIHRLTRALDRQGLTDSTQLRLRSFELDPGASTTPTTIMEIFTRKHGVSHKEAAQAEAGIARTAAEEGLPFTSDRPHANSVDVHRVLQFAERQGHGVAFFETVQRGYFAGRLDPYDHDTLVTVAASIGLDADGVRAVLDGDAYTAEVRRDEDTGRRLGVTGVPFVLINDRYAVTGAQSTDAYAQALTRVSTAKL